MTGVGDGVSYSIPLERMPRLPSDHHLEKKRREAGEFASRRAAANTGILFATGLGKARAMPDRKG
jgi:hypothetical protein